MHVCVYAHTSAAPTLGQEAETGEANSLSALSPYSHTLDLCPKPTHTEPFLSTFLVLKNLTKSPGMWEES